MKIKPWHAILLFIILFSLCISKNADETKASSINTAVNNASAYGIENASMAEINETENKENKTRQINPGSVKKSGEIDGADNASAGILNKTYNADNATDNSSAEKSSEESKTISTASEVLISKTCRSNEIFRNNKCIPKVYLGAVNKSFNYTLRGRKENITITLYLGLADYLSKLPKVYSCIPRCPSDKEIELIFINNELQKEHLKELVEKIKERAKSKDEQARIAISIVQNLDYDETALIENNLGRYPYEVLFDMRGSCEEKSRLLAFLMRELGFGVAFFDFEEENHMAVGIKCPIQYSYRKTNYCFVETSAPLIITDAYESYGNVYLNSEPEVIVISNGSSFESVYEEYRDVLKLLEIKRKISEKTADARDYEELENLIEKYGLKLDDLSINIPDS